MSQILKASRYSESVNKLDDFLYLWTMRKSRYDEAGSGENSAEGL